MANTTSSHAATLLSSAVESSSLDKHLDSDTCDYIVSLLEENPQDEDAREAVMALIAGSVNDDNTAEQLCAAFFQLLNFGTVGSSSSVNDTKTNDDDKVPALRKLEQSVTLKDHDVETFASGLSAQHDADPDAESEIQAFYANMIHPTEAAMSERARRKARQKELREKLEEEERQRAIEDAMAMLENEQQNEDEEQSMLNASSEDNRADVHFRNLDLPNLRGGGPDLLQNTNLILASGRRYGLMGRNGCGKTTLLTCIATRQAENSVPTNMSMLLVRQEIMGNEWTAVETVLKSDVKRTSVKRFIKWCEDEIDKLEQNNESVEKETGEEEDTKEVGSKKKKGSNNKSASRQRLRDRKKLQAGKNAKTKKSSKEEESLETKKSKLAEKLHRAYERLAQLEQEEGGDPEPRARKVLRGLGFSTEMQDTPTKALSGGWRMRVSLSCALFASPSLLLLDEPSNHLDLEAVLWLERYLTTQFKGTLVVVSHDRHFLNEVVTDVVHFHRNKLTTYRGDVTNFEAVREEDRIRQVRQREQQEAKRAHFQKYIDLHAQAGENGVKAARQRKSKMKKLDKLGVMAQDGKKYKASYDGVAEEVEEYVEDDKVVLRFPDPGSFDGDIMRLEQVTFGYTPDKILLRDIDLSIDLKSRVALLGRNGCGKSTLIKLIVGALQPLKGKATIDGRAKIEYLAQHQLEQLDPDGTPMQTMIDRYPGDGSNAHIAELRRYLANFGLGGEILPKQRIHTMSGGQKCRLCLACAMYRKPHMLILDEPSNHLDLESIDALIEAIRNFQGGVLLVSHDQHLLTSVCKHLYVVENGTLELLRQGMSNGEAFQAYKKAVVQGRR